MIKTQFPSEFPQQPEDFVDDEDWEEMPEFDRGDGYESESEYVNLKPYFCPRCKRKLFDADINLHGVIFVRCRRCKREIAVKTFPEIRRIGFIDTFEERSSKLCGDYYSNNSMLN